MVPYQMAMILQRGPMGVKRQHIVPPKILLLLYVLFGLLPLMIPPQSVGPLPPHPAPKFGNDKGVSECIYSSISTSL
jgi:hypothetical protein